MESVRDQSLQLTGQLASTVMRTVGLPVEAPQAKRSTDEVHTWLCYATVDPKWCENFSYTHIPPDASGVEIEVWDWVRRAGLPARPPLCTPPLRLVDRSLPPPVT